MTIPCDKGPTLERIEGKIDALTDKVSKIAVLQNDVQHLDRRTTELEANVKELNNEPKEEYGKLKMAGVGAFFGAFFSWLVQKFGGMQ